jgi:hypothetical protein
MTHARRAQRAQGRIELPAAALGFLAAWAALLLLAPPADNGFWGVNGFRSLEGGTRLALLLVAALTAGLVRVRSRGAAAAVALTLAVVVAFPLREPIHFLGDTQVRLRAMAIFTADMISVTMTEWSTRLHANPFDILIDFLVPIGLRRLGLPLVGAVSAVTAVLALVYLAGLWRIIGRLNVAREARVPLWGAMVLSGALLAFAGYAESAGLLLAAAAWWWSEMMSPLDRPHQAWRTAGAWLALALCHRLALAMLLPMAWRALGPPFPGDQRPVRRLFLGASAAALLVVGGAMQLSAGGRQLGMDLSDLMRSLTGMLRAVPPRDYLNTLALVAPLAWMAPWFAGRSAVAAFIRQPAGGLLVVSSLVVLPVMWILPANGYGLGAHRDWDLATLGGLTLTIAAAALLATLPAPRVRGALLAALPVLALGSGGWLLVNASEQAVLLRARALVEKPPGLIEPHAAQLHDWLGQRAMSLGEPAYAAPEFERSFELNRNPRRALLASEAWARAGDLPHARAMLARAYDAGPLSPSLTESARRLAELITRMAADSSGVRAPESPGGP